MTPAWTRRFSADEDTADKLAIHELAVAAWTPIMDRYRMIVGASSGTRSGAGGKRPG